MTNSDVFGGASRFKGYEDSATTQDQISGHASDETERPREDAVPSPVDEDAALEEHNRFVTASFADEFVPAEPVASENPTRRTREALAGELLTAADAEMAREATHSRSAWKAFLAKIGVGTGPSKAELAERQAQQAKDETTIRQQTWTRAVNVGVLNAKGGSGVTPGALIAGGIVSDIRGGGLAVLEFTQNPGALAFRAEGRPRRGMGELLEQATFIESAGNLAGYTAPQTSHAAVIGSVSERAQLTPHDVSTVRAVIDTYYQLSVSDLDNNLGAETSLAAQRSMDAALIPCTANNQSLARAAETVLHLTTVAPHLFTRSERPNPVVIVVGHDGSPEDEEVAAAATQVLHRETRGLAEIVECPYDPIFAASSEITLSNALPATRAAWTRAVATALENINDATPVTFTEGAHQS